LERQYNNFFDCSTAKLQHQIAAAQQHTNVTWSTAALVFLAAAQQHWFFWPQHCWTATQQHQNRSGGVKG
jgi:hypothetical protein